MSQTTIDQQVETANPVSTKISVTEDQEEKFQKQLAVRAASNYVFKNKVGDFALYPTHIKLACFQTTPKRFIKKRKVGSVMVPYIAHQYAEKVLNFVFNFQISSEIVKEELRTETVNGKKFHIGKAVVKFTFWDSHFNREIIRTVVSSHKGFDNPATTPEDATKSAVSKAWTLVAKTFGIGHDLDKKEEEVYQDLEDKVIEGEPINVPVDKSFDPDFI